MDSNSHPSVQFKSLRGAARQLWLVSAVSVGTIVVGLCADLVFTGFDIFSALALLFAILAFLGIWVISPGTMTFLRLLLATEIGSVVLICVLLISLGSLSGSGSALPLGIIIPVASSALLTVLAYSSFGKLLALRSP